MREFVLFFVSLFFKNHPKQQQVSQRLMCNHHIEDEQSPPGSLLAAGAGGLTLLSLAAAQFCFLYVMKPDCREQISYGSL